MPFTLNLSNEFKATISDLLQAVEMSDCARIDVRKCQLMDIWKEHYSDLINLEENLFIEIATAVSLSDTKPENRLINFRLEFSKILKEVLGSDSLLLSDYYVALSVAYDKDGFLDQALEFAGRALLIRVERNGVMNHKTAESHFILGSLYIKKELFEEAKRELYSSRAIYSKLYYESNSIFVANCDFIIGQIEQKDYNFDRAYLSFYKSYHTRSLLYGEQHPLTKLAESMLLSVRHAGGTRFFCGLELKNRIRELQWNEASQTSCKYIIALFISRLNDDTVLTSDQIQALLSTSLKFYSANFAGLSVNNSAVISSEEVLLLLFVPTRPLSQTPSKEGKKKDSDFSTEGKKEQIDIGNFSVSSNALEKSATIICSSENRDSSLKIEETKSTMSILAPPLSPIRESTTPKHTVTFEEDVTGTKNTAEASKSKESRVTNANALAISPKLALPKTWRPIPPDSPLREGKVLDFQSRKFCELINSATAGPRFIRNEKGDLLLLKKCSDDMLQNCLRPKMFLFALFAWYCKGSIKQLKRLDALTAKSVNDGSVNGKTGDPKAALTVLFSRRQNLAEDTDTVGKAQNLNPTDKMFAINCPRPPRLPTSWPPVPYINGEAGHSSFAGYKKDTVDTLSDAISKPKYKMLHMVGLANVEGTFWNELPELTVPTDELFDDFEDEFNMTSKKKKVGIGAAAKTPQKSPKKLAEETVLDPQRAQNISIMLAKFGKRSIESIVEAINDFEPGSLGAGAISSLMQFIPTPEEIAKVELFLKTKSQQSSIKVGEDSLPSNLANSKPPTATVKLGKAESYVLKMSQISKLEKKLSLMSQILCSKEASQTIVNGGEAVIAAAHEVKVSGRLKFILRSFLDLNNTVLKGNKNSNLLPGFSLSAWKKLSLVKLNSGETAQSYLLFKLMQHVPESLELVHDMPSIEEARAVNLPRLSAELKKLEESIFLLQELINDEQNKTSSHGETDLQDESRESRKLTPNALSNLNKYYQEVLKYFDHAKSRLELALLDFTEICQYYGESYPPMDPELFFGEISNIIKAIQAVTMNALSKHRRKALVT